MKLLTRVLFFLIVLVAPATAEEAKSLRGVALVIGQSEYQHIAPLPNPANDARDIEKLLEDLGFDVTGVNDREGKKLERDFERFIEDAEGADVALVYYSGHGIEAGGENWLVPVDADLAAVENGGEGLVALTPLLDELKSMAPVTIFLIDACRSNPFPPGAMLKRDGKAVELSAGGLGTPRGFAAVEDDANVSLGTVIGFAAEPGRPALDGEEGQNSPYAAAILRHLGALTGNEFGLVMRMVTEEVYLKTKTQQRPWVNESLRTQLFFGGAVEEQGDDGLITGERRKLLLTIAALPDLQRQQVEQAATREGVPIDTLYGVLASLGATDIPKDAESLGKALTAQAAVVRKMIDDKKALTQNDPEILKLVASANRAAEEGAITAARAIIKKATDLAERSRAAIEAIEDPANKERIANAELFVKEGDLAALQFDGEAAAAAYATAFDWVKTADLKLAAKYKSYEADALQTIADIKGDPKYFEKAIPAYEKARALVGRDEDAEQWAKATNNLANTYLKIGERAFGNEPLEKAIALYREALEVPDDDKSRTAVTLSNLGIALNTLAGRNNDAGLYAEAEASYAAALKLRDKVKDPVGWAGDMLNAANLDVDLGNRNADPQRFDAAKDRIDQALALLDPARDRYTWAQGMNNLGIVLRLQGANRRDDGPIRESIKVYEKVLATLPRETFPFDWGNANGNMAIAYTNIGAMTGDMGAFETALPMFKLALEEITRDRAPLYWARLQNSYGMAIQVVSFMKKDDKLMDDAAKAFRNALEVRTKEANAADWADSQSQLAAVLSAMATSRGDQKLADEAIDAYKAALEVYTKADYPNEFLSATSNLATALQGKGILKQDDKILQEAEMMFTAVLDATVRDKTPLDWANAVKNVATIQFMRGTTVMDKKMVEKSIKTFDLALEEYAKSGSFMDRMLINAMKGNAEQALALFK
jgi:uncharacterized caspase-like protein